MPAEAGTQANCTLKCYGSPLHCCCRCGALQSRFQAHFGFLRLPVPGEPRRRHSSTQRVLHCHRHHCREQERQERERPRHASAAALLQPRGALLQQP